MSLLTFRPVHGLIFLFKWKSDMQKDGKVVTDGSADHIYFAKQVSEDSGELIEILDISYESSSEY